ncbi:MAG TPA: hypothetical protein ENF37_10090 [Beggiatoa sp.]|nr:hypothetical protein [Beggiatoa sp.]
MKYKFDYRSKFILRPDWNACYFAARLECLLFCGRIGMPVILRPDFRSKFILRPLGMPVILRPDWNAC